ncbi:Serine/threonine-protein kinase PknB [Maioricimonas rarisocia]|uniref:Serine/threonine-protein kinase PknB n=1 Tax=Maioricimonas rarisocia TaxID=2528026 RepID=A0A517Z3J4_9PLAN|nr:bifunctional serine/threonine-protein kinase/formylglycine-generating enzyme family protein [Maioricimonas rarisocia]QDU37064.1 Serine/threonine-protein kinase PknB [Maioricimonas rarisocia]
MSISDGLPQGFENLDADDKIDVVCDHFEAALLAGKVPRIEAYLDSAPQQLRRSLLIELFGLELEYRRQHDAIPDFSEYARRFPHESRMLWRHFFDEFNSQSPACGVTLIQDQGVPANDTSGRKNSTLGPGGPDYRRVGRYLLDGLVRRDAEGDLWRGFDPELNREVMIRLSPAEAGIGPGAVVAQLHRARKVTHLHHPGIVGTYDAGAEDGRYYIVTEVVEGEPLRQHVSAGNTEHRQIAELIAQVADALAVAHASGALHLNLSPDQIVVDLSGRPRLQGFAVDAWTICGDDAGQLAKLATYRAPEQFVGKTGDIGVTTDVYALGMVLYELLSGQPPYCGVVQEITGQVLTTPPIPLQQCAPGVSDDLAAICSKAIAREPQSRYSSAEELADDLRRYLDGKTSRASRVSFWHRADRAVRRRPWEWLTVLVAFLGIAVACSVALWDDGRVRVQIATQPSGAAVTFVPLSDADGRPLPHRAVAVDAGDVLEARLPPGKYLVVAVVEGHGFHEVWRHVPHPDSNDVPGPYPHQRWSVHSSGLLQRDVVTLPAIDIPDDSVVEEMVLVKGASAFEVGDDAGGRSSHMRPMRDFYLERTELTWRTYHEVTEMLPPFMPPHERAAASRLDEAATYLTFDQAVVLAERLGKRLPDEFEFEYAATRAGTQRFPWGHDAGPGTHWTFGAVTDHEYDIVTFGNQPPIIGLYSNVAEWTSSRPVPYPGAEGSEPDVVDPDLRVVRGGPWSVLQGTPDLSEVPDGPRERIGIPRMSARKGLGVRFARSAVPRVLPEHFAGSPDERRGE